MEASIFPSPCPPKGSEEISRIDAFLQCKERRGSCEKGGESDDPVTRRRGPGLMSGAPSAFCGSQGMAAVRARPPPVARVAGPRARAEDLAHLCFGFMLVSVALSGLQVSDLQELFQSGRDESRGGMPARRASPAPAPGHEATVIVPRPFLDSFFENMFCIDF